MPHVIVKLYAGRSEAEKIEIAEAVTKAIMATARCSESAVSVGVLDVQPSDWAEKVFRADIISNPDIIYKKPGYDPL